MVKKKRKKKEIKEKQNHKSTEETKRTTNKTEQRTQYIEINMKIKNLKTQKTNNAKQGREQTKGL